MNFKIIFRISTMFFLIVVLFYFLLPQLEFIKPEFNRIFGIFFNVFCVFFLALIFLKIKTVKNNWLAFVYSVLYLVFLLGTLLNFYIYFNKIDPQTQFFDITTNYRNKNKKNDKIISQYYVNWKTNKKNSTNNRVYDFGPFRYYIQYNIDTLKLDKKEWIKEN